MVIDEHATRRWPDRPRANNLFLRWRRTRNEDVTSRNFKPRVCFLRSVPAKNYYVCVIVDLVRRENGKDEEDGEGIDDTHAARVVFVFILRGGGGGVTLDRNFLPFGRIRREICQNWIDG